MFVYLLVKNVYSHAKKKLYAHVYMYVYLLVKMFLYTREEKTICSCIYVCVFTSEESLFTHEENYINISVFTNMQRKNI